MNAGGCCVVRRVSVLCSVPSPLRRRNPRTANSAVAAIASGIAPPTPAPLAPPINPGSAAAPPTGLSPLLTQPGPVFPNCPPSEPASYPPQQLPGPIDQQKMQAYRNELRGQQWQLQRQGVSPGSQYSREIQQQLNQPGSQ